MGNKHSHEDADAEDNKQHSGTFRDRLKARAHGPIPTPGQSAREDVDNPRRMSSNSTNSSDKEWGNIEGSSPDVKSPLKQDGITKLAKVCLKHCF